MPKKKKRGLTAKEVHDVLCEHVNKDQHPLPSPLISKEELDEACDRL
jgi:hypothetical protein